MPDKSHQREELAPLPDPQVRPLISIPEAGRYFGVGRSGSYDLAAAGVLPLIQTTKGRRLVSVAALRRQLGVDA